MLISKISKSSLQTLKTYRFERKIEMIDPNKVTIVTLIATVLVISCWLTVGFPGFQPPPEIKTALDLLLFLLLSCSIIFLMVFTVVLVITVLYKICLHPRQFIKGVKEYLDVAMKATFRF